MLLQILIREHKASEIHEARQKNIKLTGKSAVNCSPQWIYIILIRAEKACSKPSSNSVPILSSMSAHSHSAIQQICSEGKAKAEIQILLA